MQHKKVTSEKFSVKKMIVLALLFMMIGTLLELYLLDHYEDAFQLIPVLCIAISLINLIILFFKRSKIIIKLFKLVLVLTSFSGVYGVFLHLQSNFEFEQDMKPTATNWELFSESLSGALPTLAPMSMLVLAFIGYSYLILINQQHEKI
ncbi:hypothetical protein OAT76_03645 [Flavobacteriaceae bacterium]|nr:hypothetical protein [Flavobacteriaceae bacterium]